jgi:hypothetical protein
MVQHNKTALVTRASRPDKRHQLSLINAIQEEEVS